MTKASKAFQILIGIALLGVAGATTYIDVSNDWQYAVKISMEFALGFLVAALGILVFPSAASLHPCKKWKTYFYAATAVCVSLTIFCAYHAYKAKQDAILLDSRDKQETHDNARNDAIKAREQLRGIKESRTVEDLQKLAEKATTEVTAKCSQKRKEACTRAKDKAAIADADLANGRSRDKLEAIVKASEAHAGKSVRFETDSIETERLQNWIMTLVIIFFTPFISLSGGAGVELIASALIAEKITQKQAIENWRKDTRKTPTKKRTKKVEPLPVNVSPIRAKA